MYNVIFPDTTQKQMTEPELRDFASGLNPQIAWKTACQKFPIQKVIDAVVNNGYVITQV